MKSYERAISFWVGCIGTRVALALVARRAFQQPQREYPIVRSILVCFCLVVSITWCVHYFLGTRPVAFEAGGPVWWNALRPAHAALYILFVWHAVSNRSNVVAMHAWRFLALDVGIGVLAWLVVRP